MNKETATRQLSSEMQKTASQIARDRARTAQWSLEVAIFLFAVLIIVIILLFEGVAIEIVGPVAAIGLILVWVMGWAKGRRLYQRFYDEELARLEQDRKMRTTEAETIEEKVQKALRERLR